MTHLLVQGVLPIVVVQEHVVIPIVMGYREYYNKWIPIIGEVLKSRMEIDNDIDKHVVAVTNKDRVVEHLIKAKNGKFAKTVFFFLTVDITNLAKVTINEKAVNKGKGMGMEIPCTITFTGTKPMLNKLKDVLKIVKFNKKYMVLTCFCLSVLNFYGIIL